jgi:signal transduction histidine kinase
MSEEDTIATLPQQPHLLVIDDDVNNRELMRRLFSATCRVSVASNGRSGLEIIESEAVDVVLLDVMMPGITGYAVLEQVRANPVTADLPVILVSGLSDTDHVVGGLELGANDYLTKPINIHVAQARVGTQIKLKRLLDEQKRAIAQLEQLSQLREHFFRIASHDLKNPLTNLHLAVSELNMFVPQNEETRGIQDNIDTTLEQMQTLIEDFLDAAALENTTLELLPSGFDLRDCLEQVVKQYARTASRKDITLCIGEVEGVVVADRNRLMQVIGNLLSNAIKFSPNGTTVSLWTQASGDRLRIFVQDEGPGIPLDEQTRLFNEFVKGSSQPTDGETSTGLGLWIVSKLVRLLNGSVGLESSPGHGAIFWVELPALEMAA